MSVPEAARSLRVPVLALVACVAASLCVPAGVRAADTLGSGGVVIPGSSLRIAVSGAPDTAGRISARFAGATAPLFRGVDVTGMNDDAERPDRPDRTHVGGTDRFTASWAITNGSGGSEPFQAFAGRDAYATPNDAGTGTLSGSAPNRVLGQVAPDGTSAQIVEQAATPWDHDFSGDKSYLTYAAGDSSTGHLPDIVDPSTTNSAEAAEWDLVIAGGATRTVAVEWRFGRPALPQPPRITGGAPAAGAHTAVTSASPSFGPAIGDTAYAQAFQCALDGGSFTACASPRGLSGLADGSHTFSVRAVNGAGDTGPQTDRTWTVDTTAPLAPGLTGAPSGAVPTNGATVHLAGENGATFACSVDGATFATCTDPLTLTGLAEGPHELAVKQTDRAGNTSALATLELRSVNAAGRPPPCSR